MTQTILPTADFDDNIFNTAPLWSKVDDPPDTSGADYVSSPSGNGFNWFACNLANATDPGVDTGHVLKFTARYSGSGSNTVQMLVALYLEDWTLIAEGSYNTITSNWATYSFTLSEAQAAACAGKYDQLVIEVDCNITGAGNRLGQVSAAWLELPDTGGSTYNEATTLARNAGVSAGNTLTLSEGVSLGRGATTGPGENLASVGNTTLGRSGTVSLAGMLDIESALGLALSKSAVVGGGLEIEDGVALGITLAALVSAGLEMNETSTLALALALSGDVLGDLVDAASLDRTGGVAAVGSLTIETGTALGRLLELLAAGEIGAATYNEAFELARSSGISPSVVGVLYDAIDLVRNLQALASAGLALSDSVSLALLLGVGTGGGLAVETQVSLAQARAITEAGQYDLVGGIELTRVSGLTVYSLGELVEAMALGRSLAAQAAGNLGMDAGTSLTLTFTITAGGLVISVTIPGAALPAISALALASATVTARFAATGQVGVTSTAAAVMAATAAVTRRMMASAEVSDNG